jgi:hypothetical protein
MTWRAPTGQERQEGSREDVTYFFEQSLRRMIDIEVDVPRIEEFGMAWMRVGTMPSAISNTTERFVAVYQATKFVVVSYAVQANRVEYWPSMNAKNMSVCGEVYAWRGQKRYQSRCCDR